MPDRAYSSHGNLLTGQTRHHDRPNVDAGVEKPLFLACSILTFLALSLAALARGRS